MCLSRPALQILETRERSRSCPFFHRFLFVSQTSIVKMQDQINSYGLNIGVLLFSFVSFFAFSFFLTDRDCCGFFSQNKARNTGRIIRNKGAFAFTFAGANTPRILTEKSDCKRSMMFFFTTVFLNSGIWTGSAALMARLDKLRAQLFRNHFIVPTHNMKRRFGTRQNQALNFSLDKPTNSCFSEASSVQSNTEQSSQWVLYL